MKKIQTPDTAEKNNPFVVLAMNYPVIVSKLLDLILRNTHHIKATIKMMKKRRKLSINFCQLIKIVVMTKKLEIINQMEVNADDY